MGSFDGEHLKGALCERETGGMIDQGQGSGGSLNNLEHDVDWNLAGGFPPQSFNKIFWVSGIEGLFFTGRSKSM